MGFLEAVKTCFGKYATFEGRATRSEFWWFQLFLFILGFLFGWIPILNILVILLIILPAIAVGVRRMHDTGRTGLWVLISFIPIIGWLIYLVLCIIDTQPMDNKYGPNPKQLAIQE